MVVERHHAHAQITRDPAHRHRVGALALDQADGRGDDARTGQWLSRHDAILPPSGPLTDVQCTCHSRWCTYDVRLWRPHVDARAVRQPGRDDHVGRRRRRAPPASPGSTTTAATGCSPCTRRARTSSGTPVKRIDWALEVDPDDPLGMPDEVDPDLRHADTGTSIADERRSATSCGQHLRVLAVQPVPARRAGRDDLRGADRRVGARPRREVLRGHPDHGRGPARRDLRALPAGEDRAALPDQRQPARRCSTTPCATRAGTCPTSACRSSSRASRWPPSACSAT